MPSGRTLGEKEVDDFLAAVSEPQQSTLRELRAMLKKILPAGEEKNHYGVPAIQINGKSLDLVNEFFDWRHHADIERAEVCIHSRGFVVTHRVHNFLQVIRVHSKQSDSPLIIIKAR